MTTEYDIARAIAAGDLPSPSIFMKSAFYAVRVSGTGIAWRRSIGEFVYRDPAIWLSPEMQRRVAGMLFVIEHPPEKQLTAQTFYASILGVLILGFIRGDELWGVVRILDQRAAEIINRGNFDTSPGVVFAPGSEGLTMDIGNGDRLRVEGEPNLVDHLALIDANDGNAGVWSKGGAAEIGVQTEEIAA